MDYSLALDVATRFGVPVAILGVVLVYHAKVIRAKDAELARINDLRVEESKKVTDKMIERDGAYLEMMGDIDKTLTVIGERMSKRGA
jgi:hypothetical protein